MHIQRPLYGIIGGMGPMASADFLMDIYSKCSGLYSSENNYPRIILSSDSLAPDRWHSFTNDNFRVLSKYIEKCILKLQTYGVTKIMICCLVAHACLININKEFTNHIVSMIDLLNNSINQKKSKMLLLATPMFYQANLITNSNVLQLELNDLDTLTDFLKKIKISNERTIFEEAIKFIEKMMEKYQVKTMLLACSELHLINRFIKTQNISFPYYIIDAMDLAANYIIEDMQGDKTHV